MDATETPVGQVPSDKTDQQRIIHAAREHFLSARALARNSMERRFLEQRINGCDSSDAG